MGCVYVYWLCYVRSVIAQKIIHEMHDYLIKTAIKYLYVLLNVSLIHLNTDSLYVKSYIQLLFHYLINYLWLCVAVLQINFTCQS